jgi:single-strand DNA-binding protein
MTHQTGVFRIGKDAELRTAGNTSVINLALASNYGKKGDDGKKPTQWIDAALWGKRAEALEQYLVKGQQVYCVLKDVHIETYEKRDSGTASKLVAEILDIELVGSSGQSGERNERPRAEPRREERPRQQAPQRSSSFDDMDDDIPF